MKAKYVPPLCPKGLICPRMGITLYTYPKFRSKVGKRFKKDAIQSKKIN